MKSDGIILLLDAVYFNGRKLGYISENGIDWGGDNPEYIKVWAAQQRGAPVKKIKKKDATNLLTFKMIELIPQNCVDVMGGTVTGDKWEAPSESVLLEGPLKILCGTGETIDIKHVTLDGMVRGTLGGDDPLGISCEMEMQAPSDGGSPFSMYPTEPFISITPESLQFESAGGEKTAQIESSGEIAVGQVPEGFKVSVGRNGLVTVTATASSGEQRTGTVEFSLASDSSRKVTLTVSQSA